MGLLARLLQRRIMRQDGRALASGTRADQHTSGQHHQGAGGIWANPMSGMGGSLDRSQSDTYLPGMPVNQWLADALLETNAIARRIAGREPEDCTREGYDVIGPPPEVADAIEDTAEGGSDGTGLGLLGQLAEARTWARAHGGGALVMLVDDGREPDEPIDRQNIRAVRGVLSADRWELPVLQWGRDPKEQRTFGRPRLYRLQLNRGGGAQQVVTVHADRVVRLDGVPLPRRLKLRRQGWGGSIFDLVFSALRAYGGTHVQVVEAVTMLNQGVLKSPALTYALEGEGEGPTAFRERLIAFRQAMGTYGEAAIGDEETYEIHNRSLSGLDAAVKASVDALVAAADGMPRLILLGEVTAGLSNTADGELRFWYDGCAARQPKIYTPAVRRVLDLVQLSHEGPTGGRLLKYTIEWRPLWQESEASRADIEVKQAQRRSIDIASLVVTPRVARQDPSVTEIYGDLGPEPPVVPGEVPDEPAEGPLAAEVSDDVDPDGVVQLVTATPSTKPLPPDLMEPRDAAKLVGISTHRMRKMMRAGDLEFWTWGGADRVSLADVTALGQRHRQGVESAE